jgi:glycosyltransferase involved in cell wall biosynthesis
VAGAERVVISGVRALQDAGIDARIFALEARPGAAAAFLDAAKAAGANVEILPAPRSLDVRAAMQLRRFIASMPNAPVLHAHGYRALALCHVAAMGGRRVIATVHGFTSHDRRARLYEWIERRLCRRTAKVVAVSDPLAALLALSGVSDHRLVVVDNPLPRALPPATRVDARQDAPQDARRLVCVGRLSHEKGLDVLLRALARLPSGSFWLQVVGDGPQRDALVILTRELGLQDSVAFSGYTDDVAQALMAADLFVLPSRTEGTPLALLEAMASGRPALATAVGGVPNALARGAGVLVPPDDVGALAGALQEALGNLDALGARAVERSEGVRDHYRAGRWAEQMVSVYRDVHGSQRC